MSAEFVIGYDRAARRFGSATIHAAFVQRGADDELPLKIDRIEVDPADVIDVVPDPSSTDTVAVLDARLNDAVAADERVLDRVKEPVTVRITATPVAEQTASVIFAEPVEVTQTCTVRVDPSQRISECDELGAWLERAIERRIRMRDQIERGIVALRKATFAQRRMEEDYRVLESQHTEALAYLGAAGAVAVAAFGAVAVSSFRVARAISQIGALFPSPAVWGLEAHGLGGLLTAAEYTTIASGMPLEMALPMAQAAATSMTTNYATAAAATTGAAVTAGTWETIRQKMNAGLTEAQTAMATAARMRDALHKGCEEKNRELEQLQRDIDETRSRMRGCPDVELIPEPPEPPLVVPSLDDMGPGPIRG